MQAFEYFSPTKLVFGLDCIKSNLSQEIKNRGYHKVLMTYGGGSLKLPPSYDGGFSWTRKRLSDEMKLTSLVN